MRVFVTGATGFVGSAVVQQLLGAGHQVLGLVRSEASAAALHATGAEVLRGDLQDLDSLRSGASQTDGVIHTAFIHDFSKFKENCEIDGRAIEAIGSALIGTEKPLIVTSGTALLSPGRLASEDLTIPAGAPIPRVSEQAAEALAARGVNTAIVRLPPSVHGDGDHGFIPILINLAKETGVAAYVGDGLNLWPAVHRLDAGSLYRLVLEKGVPGGRYHGVADSGVPFRDIAAVIGRRLGIPVVSKPPEEAASHFTWFAHFASVNCPASSADTQKQLGWQPTHTSLIADIDRPIYFGG